MPLFIDLHVDDSLTPDQVKMCHIADKEIQEKYGVRYIQVLLNEPQGYLFCLVEGPDKETCAKVHQEAHGNVACNVLEITESDFSSLLLGTQKDALDFTINALGAVDNGIRAILTFNVVGPPKVAEAAQSLAMEIVSKAGGRNTESLKSPYTYIFDSCTSAVDAAVKVRNAVSAEMPSAEIRLGVASGMPLEKEGNFFENTRKIAHQFAFITDKSTVAVCADSKKMYHGKANFAGEGVRIFSVQDEAFILQVLEFLATSWDSTDISISDFAEALALSKSQFTRKLKTVTTLSPNDLIREFRLRQSINLMFEQGMNVAEVTQAIGFSNPSYFTKVFRDRFGKTPTEFQAGE